MIALAGAFFLFVFLVDAPSAFAQAPEPEAQQGAGAAGELSDTSGAGFTDDVALQRRLAPVPDDRFVYKLGVSLFSSPPNPLKNDDEFDSSHTRTFRLQIDSLNIRSSRVWMRDAGWYANFSYVQNGLKGNTIQIPANNYRLVLEEDKDSDGNLIENTIESASQEVIFDYRLIGAGVADRVLVRQDTSLRGGFGLHAWSRTTTETISEDLARLDWGYHLALGVEWLPLRSAGLSLDYETYTTGTTGTSFIGVSLLLDPVQVNNAYRGFRARR